VKNILSSERGAYSEATRQRVRAAAARRGYRPSQAARMLRQGHSNVIGLLVPHLLDPYHTEVVEHLTAGFENADLMTMIGMLRLKTPAQTLRVYECLLAWRVRACLVIHHAEDTTTAADVRQVMTKTFLVTLNNNRWRGCAAVWPDRQEMARLAVEHLVGFGHRRVGMLGYPVPSHDMTNADANPRTGRLNQDLRKFGLRLDMRDLHLCATPETTGAAEDSEMLGFELGRRFARTVDRPTAMVCWNERLAARFILGFATAGGRIPHDISVLTFNHSRFAATASMPMTAVGVRPDRYAAETVQLVLAGTAARDNGQPRTEQRMLVPELIVRDTTGPAFPSPTPKPRRRRPNQKA
jgi:LacI family transcriptional regulator